MAVADGLGRRITVGGFLLAQALVGAGFGFAMGFLWADVRWKAESVTRRDGLR